MKRLCFVQVSLNGNRYVYVLNKAGEILAVESAYDCGHGGHIIHKNLEGRGFLPSDAAWCDGVRRRFLLERITATDDLLESDLLKYA